MLRILLIILVALAVIIGLMRLTGRAGGDTPAAAAGAAEETGALPAPVGSVPVEPEPVDEAIGALDDGATADGAAGTDVLDPALVPLPDPALDAIDEAPAAVDETIDTAIDNAAPPAGENAVSDPLPDAVITAPAVEPDATAPPGR